MRSGLAIEIRIWSKLCGPATCPKMFINSFIEDPSRTICYPGGAPTRRRLGAPRPGLGAAVPPVCLLRQVKCRCSRSEAALLQFDIETQRAELLDEHVEALGDARLEIVVAAHDRLIDLGAAGNVV